ncbi:hypothetical protein C4K05_3290 [Pseudomonas chlororaphis subsp. aureofaciens]|uniref:Uncharacterized protein n=1 Tax=Pseudomonas chlororaphis subsp. aureofaciens TaxID=587851 RepID=A0AAD0ZIV8_9PSED|nr:hypothetical protein C4K08_3300 [Pseudomonas chlororaphis subsp. aureofaciens]AZE29983.1 hypothetical protein C4K07_3198 [Pseudomonas chlororaphis subsp. aureofaciens]AZE36283.1 hypothetical protein C4K06_3250 [Pseudomonas chlororaphis subsp. aureofaciens]AZE42630.1 hypothetical protein C4K05_3290 [Pseudomonas chlororaphis subsp. aureofaciens]
MGIEGASGRRFRADRQLRTGQPMISSRLAGTMRETPGFIGRRPGLGLV